MDPISAPGLYTVVPYDGSGRAMSPMGIEHGTSGGALSQVWEAIRIALPAKAQTFALYDRKGDLIRIGVRPAEPLTDDRDVTTMALDPTGAWVVTGHADGNVRLWDLSQGDPVWTRAPADEPIVGALFVEAGPWILCWCDDGPMLLFEPGTGALLLRVEDPQSGAFYAVPSPDGREVACSGPQVTRIALPDGQALHPLDTDVADAPPEGDQGVHWMGYLPDGETIVGLRAGAERDALVFWDRATGRRRGEVAGLANVAACDLSPDGRTVALGISGERTQVLLVDTTTRAIAHTVETQGTGIYDLRFARGNGGLILHDAALGVVMIDPHTGALGASVREDGGTAFVIPGEEAVIPEEKESPAMIITHGADGKIQLTAPSTRGPFPPIGRSVSTHGARYAAVPFDTDNDYVTVYDLVTDAAVATLPHRGNVQEIWLSSEGTRVAVRAAGSVTAWCVPDIPWSVGTQP